MRDDSDQLLVQRVRQGDAQAWKQLIARYEGRLLAFADSRLNNKSLAEDVVQESFLGFLVSLPNYDGDTPLENWLFSIAAHKLTDQLRREGRRPRTAVSSIGEEGKWEPPAGGRRASSLVRSGERRDAEQKVIAGCLQSLIRQWFDRGEWERLQCLELVLVLGWSNKAVARRLGISEQAVANHKHFVISKLKQAARRARGKNADSPE